jgi:hypothetical protein
MYKLIAIIIAAIPVILLLRTVFAGTIEEEMAGYIRL